MIPEQRAELIAAGWTPPTAPEPDWDACLPMLADVYDAFCWRLTANSIREGTYSINHQSKVAIRAIIKHADLWAEQARQLKDIKC